MSGRSDSGSERPSERGPERDAPDPVVVGVVEAWLAANELEHRREGASYSFALPGERKLQTPVRLDVGSHALALHAFVCRRPDENHERFYRWLLERNLKTFGVAFALDAVGDVYLDGRLPLAALHGDGAVDELDRLLGALLETADGTFNTLLELGFASSIRAEWEWRVARGEPTHNLAAFRGWLEAGE